MDFVCRRIDDYDSDGNELPLYDSDGDIIPDLVSIHEFGHDNVSEEVTDEVSDEELINYSIDISYNTINNVIGENEIINYNENINDFNNLEIIDNLHNEIDDIIY
jgi:hypothetical protein